MIKLIIFDLDGVLIESKDTHYQALNKALEDFNLIPITYTEHISDYDGLPTRKKLKKREIDETLHNEINKKKQEYTVDLLEKNIKKSPKLINIFKKLREEDYFICVASNSILYTVQLIVNNLGLLRHTNWIISNEDVSFGKPNPEMYLKCMLRYKLSPKETMIIEDSYVGREGAYNSGAHLLAINKPIEVTYSNIKNHINKYNKVKQTWKGNKMNILIPMAGAGSRFSNAGYTFPKPLIDVAGKSMIETVIENINIEANYIFIVQKKHYKKYNLKSLLRLLAPKCKIIQIDKLTEGAACTTLLAKKYINNNEQLLIANSDQWVDWDSSDFMYQMQNEVVDGGVLTFKNHHPKWSYVKLNNGFVTEVREKEVISDDATVGIYYFKRGCDYVKYAESMIEKNLRVNNEFYVAPVYNEAIDDGMKIKPYRVNEMMGLGTPEDLKYFLESRK